VGTFPLFLQFSFPASVPRLYFFCTLAQSPRLSPSCYFPPRSINMDMRLAASSARRARYDNRTEPHARASADNRIRIAAPSEAALGPTRDPLSLLPSPPSPRDFTRHAIPSNPRSDQERAPGPTFSRAWEISNRPPFRAEQSVTPCKVISPLSHWKKRKATPTK
jgi:hypothetical protein